MISSYSLYLEFYFRTFLLSSIVVDFIEALPLLYGTKIILWGFKSLIKMTLILLVNYRYSIFPVENFSLIDFLID